jgi:hypothetical protein
LAVLGGWHSLPRQARAQPPFTVVDRRAGSELRQVLREGRSSSTVDSGATPATARPSQQLPLAAFRRAVCGDTDIVGRNTFPRRHEDVDLGIYKTFSLLYGHSMTVRVEMFNAFNWVQFGFPQNNINTANFGRVNTTATTYSPRVVQFAVRYRF